MRTAMTKAILAAALFGVGCSAHTSSQANSSPSVPTPSAVAHGTPDVVRAEPAQTGRKQGVQFEPEDVERVVHQGTPALRECYERSINVSKAEDRVKASWVIDTMGKPSRVRIEETTIQSPDLEACVTSTILSWTFPPPPDQIEVAFPFVFQTDE